MDHKTPGDKFRFARIDQSLLAVLSILLLGVTGYILYDYATPSWQGWQSDFRELVAGKFGEARAAAVPAGLQQIYVPELGSADRCITCHQAVEWKGLENAPEPFRTHPRDILTTHPVSKFGCTPCHGGQGYATDERAAHGFADFWEAPLLGKELGEFYVMSDRSALMQINCNICHRYDREIKGAPYINRAKDLVAVRGCRACHVINGRGGTVGPDLTYEGDKSAEQFNYERIKGMATVFSWHVAHFKGPKDLVPGSVMPNFGLSSQDAQALAMLVMSWKRTRLPLEYIPGINLKDVPTAEEKAKEERMTKGPGAFFVRKNCFVCHSVSTLGIEAAAQIGPDLALAVEDVQSRFGRTLDDFLARPTGTMDVVLSTMIPLTPQEKSEAIGILRMAHELKQKERGAKN